MVIATLVASAILTLVFLVQKRRMEKAGGKRMVYHFVDKSLEVRSLSRSSARCSSCSRSR